MALSAGTMSPPTASECGTMAKALPAARCAETQVKSERITSTAPAWSAICPARLSASGRISRSRPCSVSSPSWRMASISHCTVPLSCRPSTSLSWAQEVMAMPASTRPAANIRAIIALLLCAGNAPDDVAHIVRHQHGAIPGQGHAHRPPEGIFLVRREEIGEDFARHADRLAVLEFDESQLVAGEFRAVPGSVLADGHALRKARQGPCRQPAKPQRGRVTAQGIIGLQGGSDLGRVLRHAIVHHPVPIAIGPAVKPAI